LKKILIFGANGMLGHTVLRLFADDGKFNVIGTVRSEKSFNQINSRYHNQLISGLDVTDVAAVNTLINEIKPNYVINCIGLVKQLAEAEDPLLAIPINSLFPHQLASACQKINSRLIHISTDCVFAGIKGSYTEEDVSDATDLYGRSKFLGEVDYPGSITLRTSIIGHELEGAHGLIDWFIGQEGEIQGYRNAIFSGLPTVEVARVIRDYVIPNQELSGLYHLASKRISKYDLLNLVATIYDKKIAIKPNDQFTIDRSLVSEKFSKATGYEAGDWTALIQLMHNYQ
jgi:dTDP-4-dehydrorhamnose reductase